MTATFVGLGIAIWIAWCLEIQWLLGLTEFDTMAEVSANMVGPSPFLITPLATVATILIGWLLSLAMPERDMAAARKLGWLSVVRGGGEEAAQETD